VAVASIRKRTRAGRVSWEVRYTGSDRKQRSRTFRRKVDATAFVHQVEVDLQQARWTDPALGRMPVEAWAREWQASRVDLRPSTRARDARLLADHVLPTFGKRRLVDVGQPDVRRWVASLTARGLAPATVQKSYQVMAGLMGAAVDAGLIAASPCRRVPLPRIEREEMRFLTPAEVGRLADAIDPRYRALVLLAAYGGLRIGELAALRRHRVDLLRGTVTVAETLAEVEGHVSTGAPKTRASRRTVGLPRAVVEALADHLAGVDPAPDALVFTAPAGGPLRVSAWRARQWRPAVAAAGLDGLRIHDLRHTAVALWIAAGASPREVATRAGHTSTRVVLDVYGHLYPESDATLRGRLDDLIAAAEPPPEGAVLPLDRG
jgi:integrase